MSDYKRAVIDAFLEGEDTDEETKQKRRFSKVWFGESDFKDRVEVKRLCRGPEEEKAATAFDPARKLWGTHSLANVSKLIASGMWRPVGVDASLSDAIGIEAAKRVREKARADEEKKLKREREEERKRTEKAQKAAEKAQKAQQNLFNKKQKVVNCDEQKDDNNNNNNDYKDDDDDPLMVDAIRALERIGIPREVFKASYHWPWLGPQVRLKPEVRVLRWLNYPDKVERGLKAVIQEDFVNVYEREQQEKRNEAEQREHERIAKQQQETSAAKAQAAAHAVDDTLEYFESLRAEQQEEVELNKRRAYEREHSEEALAFQAILERAEAAKIRLHAPIVLKCGVCGVRPMDQFMECACIDGSGWKKCFKCDVVCHVSKALCACV